MPAAQPTVLFLCADNSIRSQLGEALLRHRAGDLFDVHSAGLQPKPVHPLVGRVLREVGAQDESLSSKRLGPMLGKRSIRYAVILRDADETDAPRIFPFAARTMKWNVADPTASETDGDELDRFRRVRDDIDARLTEWIREVTSERPSSAA